LIDERLAVHLDTMRQGAQDAIAFVHGMSQEQFLTDQKTQAAVMMAFIRIGESATSIEKRFPDFVDAHPDWPWLQMRAMRNRGVHGYDSINFTIIWDTLQSSLPGLLSQLHALGSLDPRNHSGS
jgi:uncharacterized protein with HEPN domain